MATRPATTSHSSIPAPIPSPALAAAAWIVGIVWIAGLVVACSPSTSPEGGSSAAERVLYRFEGSTMGTYYVVKVVEPQPPGSVPEAEREPLDEAERAALGEVIEEELELVNRLMSTWIDDSELSRFNGHDSTDAFALSQPTAEVLAEALEIARATGGALDPTVASLVAAWGFGPEESTDRPAPSDEEIEALLGRTGYELVRVDAEAEPPTATKEIGELRVELSSLAKGYAVDRVLEALADRGHENVMVEVGGEVRTAGTNLDDVAWRMAIERPSVEVGSVQRIVPLSNRALATSGDYRNYREIDGERVSHLLDPRTGRPIGHRLASVSVAADTCLRADGLATALMVLGPEDGLVWAEENGVDALFLVREGEDGFVEKATSSFTERYENGADAEASDAEGGAFEPADLLPEEIPDPRANRPGANP